MKTRRIVIITILFLLGNPIIAQQIKVNRVDNSEFPLITVTIEIPEDVSLDFNKLQVAENGEQKEISIDSNEINNQQRMLCFLVDESLLTSSKSKELVGKILENSIERLKKTDLFDILFTGSSEAESICMHPLSFEFTSDFSGLVKQFKSGLLTGNTNGKVKDLYCSVDASLDFIQSKSKVPGEKYLILLKDSNTNIKDWQSLQAKANAHLIKLRQIEIPSEVNEKNEQRVLITTIKQLDSLRFSDFIDGTSLKSKSYRISFYTKQNNKLNTFNIKYLEQELKASFRKPDYSGFIKQNLIFIIVITFLLILSIFLTIKVIRAKKKSIIGKKQSALGKAKIVAAKKSIPPIDPKITNYGSVTPYVTIELEDQVDKFELRKLRTTIGRHSDNDILIANLTISNHHATITNEGGVFYIQDNESTNGTFVNDIKITKSTLKIEDSVRLGKAKLSLTY